VLVKYRIHEQSVSRKNKEIQATNSTIIKQRLFKHIGVSVNESELEFYQTIGQFEYERNKKYLSNAQIFLEKMVRANDCSNFLEKRFFEQYIAQLWFNVAYNLTTLGSFSFQKYSSSVLSSFKSLNFLQRVKFKFKAFFKI
jgi:U3 small nucleolar ribonucleoprotein component